MDTYDKADFINEIFDKIQELLRKAELCQYLIDNCNVLSDEYLTIALQELAINILNEEDYYKIISIHDGKKYYETKPIRHYRNQKRLPMNYDKEYHGPIDIKTTLYESVLCEDDSYKNMGVILKILYTWGVSKVTYYNKDKIQELLDKNRILILNKEYNPDGTPCLIKPSEECPKYELAFSDPDHKEFLSRDGKYYQTTLNYIKSNINCEVLGKLRNYLLTLVANEMDKASFLQKQFSDKGFQKRIGYLQSK